MVTANTNYPTNLAATTIEHFGKEIFDNIIANNNALREFKAAGNIKVVSGGTKFTHPVLQEANAGFQAISKYGTISTDLQEPFTRSEWEIKVLAGSIVYSLVDEAMNAGSEEKMIDLIQSLKLQAETSMGNLMGLQIMQSATTDADFDSIPEIIGSAVTASVGGISGSANTYWRNYTNIGSNLTMSVTGLSNMDVALNNCTYGMDGPTFIITTKSVYGFFSDTLQANQRYVDTERASAGFRHLMYATIPVYFDDNCPAQTMFFIDGNSIKLQALEGGFMKTTSEVQSYSQLMVRSLMYFYGNLTAGQRRTSGRIYGFAT